MIIDIKNKIEKIEIGDIITDKFRGLYIVAMNDEENIVLVNLESNVCTTYNNLCIFNESDMEKLVKSNSFKLVAKENEIKISGIV